MQRISTFQQFFLALVVLLSSGCSSNSGNPEVQINESSNSTTSYDETILINNCGGKAESEQTKSRSFSTSIEGGIDIGLQQVIGGAISAKYGTGKDFSISQRLVAPAGTRMEFVLRWSEEVHAGNIVVNSASGNYKAIIPIAVEQISSRDLGCDPTATLSPQQVDTSQPTTSPTESNVKYDGWVICWHGRDGYEYLIAFPEIDVRQGIDLKFELPNAQGRQIEVANDSLKMCYVDGEWYGYPEPNEWFPNVSYLKLLDKEILICSDSPNCQGSQWTIRPEKYSPWNAPGLQSPRETGIHVIAYKASQ